MTGCSDRVTEVILSAMNLIDSLNKFLTNMLLDSRPSSSKILQICPLLTSVETQPREELLAEFQSSQTSQSRSWLKTMQDIQIPMACSTIVLSSTIMMVSFLRRISFTIRKIESQNYLKSIDSSILEPTSPDMMLMRGAKILAVASQSCNIQLFFLSDDC